MSTFVWPPISLSIAASPTSFLEDGANTTVSQDTSTPSNSKPLPVKQLKTDGTELDPATEAKQDSVITELTTLNAKDFATQTTLLALLTAFNNEDFASETSLAALLSAFSSEDFASETTLAALAATDFATSAKQDTLITEIQKVSAQAGNKRVLDGYFNSSLSVPNGTRTSALVTVPASTKAVELEIICKNGDTISAYDAATSGNLIGKYTQGGGRLPVNLAATTEIFLESDNSSITASDITINLIGVDA